ncbi:MAG TPA: hypothetical protein VGD43_14865 [Micromonospora sp.]
MTERPPVFPPRAGVPAYTPSGLFPSAHRPAGPRRPTWREPHPVRPGALVAGAGATTAWLLFFGLLGRSLAGYVWRTVFAGGVAWLGALLLTRYGDRGVAAGVAMATAVGWSVASTVVAVRWFGTGDWPLW